MHLDRELTRVNGEFGILTPKEILDKSSSKAINEIAVLGKGVTVIGVFRKVLGDKPLTKGPYFPRFEKYAKTHDLPIVDIPISYETEKQKAKKKEDKALSKIQDSSDLPRKGKQKGREKNISKMKGTQSQQEHPVSKNKKNSEKRMELQQPKSKKNPKCKAKK